MMDTQYLFTIDHPIFRNHKVYGQALMPGMAHIDFLFQVFASRGYDYRGLELRNLSLFQPLIVGEDFDVLVDIKCAIQKLGAWKIQVTGSVSRHGVVDEENTLYVTAEMVEREPAAFDKSIDPAALAAAAVETRDLDDIYAWAEQRELVHSGMMRAQGTVYDTGESVLVDLRPADVEEVPIDSFIFNPTLIDASGVGSAPLFFSQLAGESRLFLPLHIGSFRAVDLIQDRCLTLIERSNARLEKELMYQTWEFFDHAGRKIGEMTNFVNKLVRNAGLIAADRGPTVKPEPEPAPAPAPTANQDTADEHPQATRFLQELLAQQMDKSINDIIPTVGYYELGLSSSELLTVVDGIGLKVGTTLSPILLFEYTNIADLAAYLTETWPEIFASPAPTDPPKTPAPVDLVLTKSEQAKRPAVQSRDVAVIGMAGRYPQAENLEQFWENLQAGRDCISEIPADRWNWRDLDGITTPSGKDMCRFGGFINDVDRFDPLFFNMSPRHAEIIDPQERLFLQTCWEAMEDAGHTPATIVEERGRHKRRAVGVFVGVMHKDYSLVGLDSVSREDLYPLSLNYAQIANRVSYSLNFHGPSMAVDTVCSSSLTALHLALQSLASGDCEAAFSGGVNLCLHPAKYVSYGMADMHATDGRCRSFGMGGDGYVPAEGVGAVLLKPLAGAIADGDHVHAVIKGSAVNHVGTVSGISVPSPIAQSEMILDCLERTGIDPRTISYVEAHGTGTALGDPIELQGLTRAFQQHTTDTQYCAIGSVKSNIGHAEAAAGISALTKTVLQLKHQQLAPSLHAKSLNPYIDFKTSPFYLQQHATHWKRLELPNGAIIPRRAAISSFGAGGANAHVILEEFTPTPAAKPQPGRPVAVVLSARDEDRLREYAQRLCDFIVARQAADRKSAPGDADLCELLAQVLGVSQDDIDMDQPFSEYGMERLQKVQLGELIQDAFAIEIPDLLERETLRDVTKSLPKPTQANNSDHAPNLEDLAYTLQVGREAMEMRLGLAVSSIEGLTSALTRFISGTHNADHGIHLGRVVRNNGVLARFNPSPELNAELQQDLPAGRYDKLLAQWVVGMNFNWRGLYADRNPKRISLPTYPFAKERYWIASGSNPITAANHPYSIQVKPTPANQIQPAQADWLFFNEAKTTVESLDQTNWRAALKQRQGRKLLLVAQEPKALTNLDSLIHQLAEAANLTVPFQTTTLSADQLIEHGVAEAPDEVLFLCSGPNPAAAVFALTRSLMQVAWGRKIRIYCLHAHTEPSQKPAFQALSGLLRSAEKENPQHQWTLIEHDNPAVSPAQALTRVWLAQWDNPGFRHLFNNGDQSYRYILNETNLDLAAPSAFRNGATYLITGGLGPVGMLLCEQLARRFQARLVILSRSELDDHKRSLCRELENCGAEVFYFPVDIGDSAALSAVSQTISDRAGPIHGVIHLARLVEDGPIIAKSWDSFSRVMRAKVDGTANLDQITAAEPLDFFMLFSSVGAYGTRGSSDYAYGAAYQNAFARYRESLRTKGERSGQSISLAWGAWTVDRYKPKNRDANMKATGMDLITIQDAMLATNAACTAGLPVCGVLAVSDADLVRRGMGLADKTPPIAPRSDSLIDPARMAEWQRRRDAGEQLDAAELHEMISEHDLAKLADEDIHRIYALFFEETPKPKPEAAQHSTPPKTTQPSLSRIVGETVSEVLGLNRLDETQSFQNYGLDSISGMQLSTRLEKRLNREIQPQWFIEYATVQSLSEYLETQYAGSASRSDT